MESGSVGPSMPATASSRGGVNATTPAEQRLPDRGLPMSDGPQRGENGEYLPAKYEVTRGEFKFTIEDR